MNWRDELRRGVVIPAHPLALTSERKLDERRQRALTRYYMDAGAGGIAVAVHTTQFEIRDPHIGLFEPVLALAAEEMRSRNVIRIAGICGGTQQAVVEAATAARLGYHAGLLSMAALRSATVAELIRHSHTVGEVIPLIGFYLQPAVGGRLLPEQFWAEFASLDCVAGIKIAPFDRYKTMDVLRGVAASGRAEQIALYTGNDDHIILDLLTTVRIGAQELRIAGGLLGHWAVWTRRVVEIFQQIQDLKRSAVPADWLTLATEVTDANAAVFDVANGFRGCIPGIHEVLRRQGLLAGTWCLNQDEVLSPGQAEELDRVSTQYPHLRDDEFVRQNLDTWLKP